MRVATLEVDLRTGDVRGNLAAVREGVLLAAQSGAALAAAPEMWPTSFVASADEALFQVSDRAVAEVSAVCADHGLAFVGSAYGTPEGPGGEELPTNRAHVLHGGQLAASYDKVHLFSPTAEHLGFRAGLIPPPVVELPTAQGGQLRDGSARVAPIVCYDLRFPEVSRAAFREGAELLVAVAQWPEARSAHWRAILRGRAAELEGYVIASNRIGVDEIGRRKMRLEFRGHSAVVAPNGEDVVPTEVVELDGSRGRVLVYDIDLEAARDLRRAVPVLRDERRDLFSSWMQRDPTR